MSRHVVVVGGGVIGLSIAVQCAQRGLRVTVLERDTATGAGCSSGNAGMVVPSHFVPLAAPGMVRLALRCLASPASPFYLAPRLSLDLLRWGLAFRRAATADHVRRAAPLLSRIAPRKEFACQSDGRPLPAASSKFSRPPRCSRPSTKST